LPYALKLASDPDWRNDPALARGINVQRGEILHSAVQAAFA